VIFLGLETSGLNSGLALVRDDDLVGELRLDHSNYQATHNETIIAAIDQLCRGAGLAIDEITGICLTIGPGMFTALRVGLSVAKGIALPRGLPVKGVNTLQALSATVAQATTELILTAIGAREGEVYAGLYQGERALIEPMTTTMVAMSGELSRLCADCQLSPVIMVAGNAAEMVEPALTQLRIAVQKASVNVPSPAVVVKLGRALMQKEGPDDLMVLEPVYLRRTDAEINRERQLKSGL